MHDEGLVVEDERIVAPLRTGPRLVGGGHATLEVSGSIDLSGNQYAAVDEQRRLSAFDDNKTLAFDGSFAECW